MVFRFGEVVFLINCNEQTNVIVVAAFFSDSLEVVVKKRKIKSIVFIASYEYLATLRALLAYALDNRRGKNSRARAGIKNRVSRSLGIEGEHRRHKASNVLLCEKPAEPYILALRFFSYQFSGISYSKTEHISPPKTKSFRVKNNFCLKLLATITHIVPYFFCVCNRFSSFFPKNVAKGGDLWYTNIKNY